MQVCTLDIEVLYHSQCLVELEIPASCWGSTPSGSVTAADLCVRYPSSKRRPMNKYAVVAEGKGLKGSAASCAELQANGGMTWACRCASRMFVGWVGSLADQLTEFGTRATSYFAVKAKFASLMPVAV
jgi:hypothetical protein